MKGIKIKTKEEIKIMSEGGKKLADVRFNLESAVKEGVNAMEIEDLANKFIDEAGGKPSFKMVPGYSWATCVNINAGLVHGIPKKELVFKKGDLVSIDVGMFYKGFHTDTSTTVYVGELKDPEMKRFLNAGKLALKRAIEQAQVGNTINDISATIYEIITSSHYSPIKALTGHGVGRDLHEEPYVPCFVPKGNVGERKIEPGMVLAIEVMYAKGGEEVIVEPDGWTIATQDGTISALFEETVAVTADGSFVLTEGK